jgi:hypothetical protein
VHYDSSSSSSGHSPVLEPVFDVDEAAEAELFVGAGGGVVDEDVLGLLPPAEYGGSQPGVDAGSALAKRDGNEGGRGGGRARRAAINSVPYELSPWLIEAVSAGMPNADVLKFAHWLTVEPDAPDRIAWVRLGARFTTPAGEQVRKTPGWPRSWANFSLL